MALTIRKNHTPAQTQVLGGLARLRASFPLEERLQQSSPPIRTAYAQLLRSWLQAMPLAAATLDAEVLETLEALDAVVTEEHGLGCYPFSSTDTGIHVGLPDGTVNAMCAIDALAIARLARVRTPINATCTSCGNCIALQVEENGGLDHDQVELASVVWHHAVATHTSCSQGLCRHIRFLCRACPEPENAEHLTLPQAAAIGNMFFRFQSALLAAHAGQTA